jgi:hypothetical protein
MDTKATATLHDGTKVQGRLTTAHAASSYGQPVFVDDDGQVYDWFQIANVKTTDASSRGGKAGTLAQNAARAANAKHAGRPKGAKNKPKKTD